MIVRSKAPLRLGLAGGGTDVSPYCDEYGGYVLNATIDMYAYCTIEPTDCGEIEIHAPDIKKDFCCKSLARLETDSELALHKGVYNRIVSDYLNGKPLSFKMTTYSDAPAGSGLGASSTMVVAIVKAFAEWLNLPLGEYDMAWLAYRTERIDLGLAGGKQDQYAATFGGVNFIEFYDHDRVIVNPLRIKKWIKNEFQNSLVLYYTGTSRESAAIINEQVKNAREKNQESIESMHILKKNASVMKEALLKGNFTGIVDCMHDSWIAKKRTAASISNPHIDEMYDYILHNGGLAAKISGAGGGGFMMILCDPKRRHELASALKKTNGEVMLTSITELGSQAWTLY
jgi:D-glycero-alpha-D-manno-heptose-7-phosphate kinase